MRIHSALLLGLVANKPISDQSQLRLALVSPAPETSPRTRPNTGLLLSSPSGAHGPSLDCAGTDGAFAAHDVSGDNGNNGGICDNRPNGRGRPFKDYQIGPKVLHQPIRIRPRVQRVVPMVKSFNTTDSVDQWLDKPLTWINRDARSNVNAVRQKGIHHRVRWVKEGALFAAKKSLSLLPISRLKQYRAMTISSPVPYSALVNGKESVTLTPKQAKPLLSFLDEMLPTRQSLGFDHRPNKKEYSADLLALVIKSGTTPEQIQQFMLSETGQLGWSLLKNGLMYPKKSSPIENPKRLMESGCGLKMSGWRDRYVKAAILKIDVDHILQEILKREPLESSAALKALNVAVQHRIIALIDEGILGPQLIKIPKFSASLNNRIFNALALERSKAGVQCEKSVSTEKVARFLMRSFTLPGVSSAAGRVSDTIDLGLIDVRPLSKKAFRRLCIDTFGYDRSHRTLGLARGAQIFIKTDFWRGLSFNNGLTFDETAVALHEGVHAMDWLDDPKGFSMSDPLVLYNKEKRAFLAENQFLKTLGEQSIWITPRFDHARDIGDFIKSVYKGANYTSVGQFSNFQKDFSEKRL